jgi:GntR family transcriptional regulator
MVVGVIEFHLDARSGVAPYMQLIQQVRRAMRLGLLNEGDKLPTVKDVVARVAINPNTVLKAYRELEYEGLVQPRPGLGTFVTRTLGGDEAVAAHVPLRADIEGWLTRARAAGLDDESIEALFLSAFRAFSAAGTGRAG